MIKQRKPWITESNRGNEKYYYIGYSYFDETGKRFKRAINFGTNLSLAETFLPKVAEWILEEKDPKEEIVKEGYVFSKMITTNMEIVVPSNGTSFSEHIKPIFVDKKRGEVDWRDFLDTCMTNQEIRNKATWDQDVCQIRLDTKKPIAISLSADWHLGASGIDYKVWKRDINYLLDTDRLYLACIGDLIHNFTQFKTIQPVFSQLISPNQQKTLLESLFLELVEKNKLLLAAAGNHDVEFDERILGTSSVQEFISRLVPFFSGKGIAQLFVGDEEYTMLLLHKTRFNSYLHSLHGAKREYETMYPADLVCTAHTHTPSFELFHRFDIARSLGKDFGGESYLVKTGSYLVDDSHSKKYWSAGIIGNPTVVLFPDQHKMVMFANASDAVAYMKGIE